MATMDSPSAHRNKEPIWSILNSTILPLIQQKDETLLQVLEIAAGCGVHTEHFATQLVLSLNGKNPMTDKDTSIRWYPTDPDEPSRLSIKSRVNKFNMNHERSNVKIMDPLSLTLDENGIMEDKTNEYLNNLDDTNMNLMICINMIHISPWSATKGLFKLASQCLHSTAGILMTYGPYKVNGTAVRSNLNFDANLKARDPTWGVRDLESVEVVAKENGLTLIKVIEMPANNLICVFQKTKK